MKKLDEEKDQNNKQSAQISNLMVSLDVENETQKKQIQELEQFVILLSSALT